MKKYRFAILTLSMATALMTGAISARAEVVATVNGESIEYQGTDKVEVADLIRKKLVEQKIKEYGIIMTAEEMKEAVMKEDAFQAITPAFLEQTQRQGHALVTALREYLRSPENSDQIYGKYLASFLPKQGWDLLKQSYSRSDQIDRMESSIPKSVEQWQEGAAFHLQDDVLQKKLADKIASEVAVTEDETEQLYATEYPNQEKPYSTVHDELEARLLDSKKKRFIENWWTQQFLAAKIEIKDERYKDALSLLIPSAK